MRDGRSAGAKARAPIVVVTVLAAIACIGVPGEAAGQAEAPAGHAARAGSAEAAVRALYRMVTFEAGKNVDWDQVKALFIPEAVIVLRASRTSMNVLNRNTFVDDFVRFIREAKLEDQAFEETIVAIKTQETGDVARSTVQYAARIPSRDGPAQHGIDVLLLMKTDGYWRIVSIVNELVRPGVEVPEEIRK